MQSIRSKIGSSKRQLYKMADVLDELYADITAVKKAKEPVNKELHTVSTKIINRMIYLNKVKDRPLMETEARLDELSRLLDWIEEEN